METSLAYLDLPSVFWVSHLYYSSRQRNFQPSQNPSEEREATASYKQWIHPNGYIMEMLSSRGRNELVFTSAVIIIECPSFGEHAVRTCLWKQQREGESVYQIRLSVWRYSSRENWKD